MAGTTGESPTLSDAEKLSLLKAVKEEVGDRATIICGTGSNDTRHSVELTEGACRAGADAVLVVTPYYNTPNRAGLRAHFEAVAEAAGDTPVVLYNIPSRCVINLAPDFLAELAAELPNVVAVKQANDADLGPIDGLDVLAGNDAASSVASSWEAPEASWSPRTWSERRCAPCTRPRSQVRGTALTSSTPSFSRSTRRQR